MKEPPPSRGYPINRVFSWPPLSGGISRNQAQLEGCTAKSKALGSILLSQMQYIQIGLEGCTMSIEFRELVDCLLLDDQILLPRRLCAWLSRNYLRGEDVILENALLDQFL